MASKFSKNLLNNDNLNKNNFLSLFNIEFVHFQQDSLDLPCQDIPLRPPIHLPLLHSNIPPKTSEFMSISTTATTKNERLLNQRNPPYFYDF